MKTAADFPPPPYVFDDMHAAAYSGAAIALDELGHRFVTVAQWDRIVRRINQDIAENVT